MLQKIIFQINTVLLNFLFICESWKIKMYHKNIAQHNTIFNIDNKSAYYYDFWRSCDTEDWKYSFDHRNKLQFNR